MDQCNIYISIGVVVLRSETTKFIEIRDALEEEKAVECAPSLSLPLGGTAELSTCHWRSLGLREPAWGSEAELPVSKDWAKWGKAFDS